jgi:hypothetical protein
VGIYAYCVVPPAQHPRPDLNGIDGSAVELLEVGEVGLWVSRTERPKVSVEAVQAHNAVVEAAVTERVTPVPLRFGQWVEDLDKLRSLAAEHAGQYRSSLDHFAGALEFGMRLIDPHAPDEAQEVRASEAATGREYMQALRESSRLADQRRVYSESVEARVRELMRDIVRDEKVETAQTRHAVLTVSHLVAREHFDEYRERARQIRTVFPALRLLLSGPWPPYSFAV